MRLIPGRFFQSGHEMTVNWNKPPSAPVFRAG